MGWPELTVDQKAWELAKVALGDDAITSELIDRAQQIKEALNTGELVVEEI